MRKYFIFIFILISACATTPDVILTEGMPHTFTLVNESGLKETVYDISGDWIEQKRSEIQIKQEGSSVKGFWKKYNGTDNCILGSIWFIGKVKGNRVSGMRYLCSPPGKPDLLSIEILGGGRYI